MNPHIINALLETLSTVKTAVITYEDLCPKCSGKGKVIQYGPMEAFEVADMEPDFPIDDRPFEEINCFKCKGTGGHYREITVNVKKVPFEITQK